MKRDEEIKRLIWYGKGLGVSFKFKKKPKGSHTFAEWGSDSTIIIYVTKGLSKLEIVLSLIHELGHHRDFIETHRKLSSKYDKLSAEEDKNTSKKARWLTLKIEQDGAKYWEQIYRDVGCSFPINLMFKRMKLDLFYYEFVYQHNRPPNPKEFADKKRQLDKLYSK